MDTNGKRRTNKRWSEALKREIVAASFAPGASVSAVARQYDVNSNQLFNWRRRFGRSSETATASPPRVQPRLVPVAVDTAPGLTNAPSASEATDSGIEIKVGDMYRVRVGANFDCRTLRRVLDCLGHAGGARETSR